VVFAGPTEDINDPRNRLAVLAPDELAKRPALVLTGIIIPEGRTADGMLIKSTSAVWDEIVKALGANWSVAPEIPHEKWEEIVAGAFKKDGYDEVTLTPRSGDFGRDVIAIRRGIGRVKIIGSVKAYAPGNLVRYDDVRRLSACSTESTMRRRESSRRHLTFRPISNQTTLSRRSFHRFAL
jgi:hypothetical protein